MTALLLILIFLAILAIPTFIILMTFFIDMIFFNHKLFEWICRKKEKKTTNVIVDSGVGVGGSGKGMS